ncbi:hypothetical protein ACFOEP_13300 [Microbacterium amylolyticum]|uniref:hypothetical protein n=1 Tax=Microbacterium amylolyticum TaxID=936337 RepID=UPI003613128B
MFWLGDEQTTLEVNLADVGCASAESATDLWTGASVDAINGAITLELEPHGTRLVALNG